ncbi:MAG: endolytic transglycosylase MltG [Ruminococcaceae bacterium]|nr:endolytic transglycosylase MltG [Oscillospiraceae bacterium]
MQIKSKDIKKIILLVLVILAAVFFMSACSVISDYHGSSKGGVRTVTVAAGSGTAQIAEALEEQGIIKNPFWFRVFSKLGGHDGRYQPGIFTLHENAGYQEIFKMLTQPPETQFVTVTIPEGFELWQIADKLEQVGLIDRDRFYEAVENGQFDYEFLRDIPQRENRLEGYLFPDTYQFMYGESEETIIDKMLARFDEVYTDEYENRAKALGMTNDELITLASIVEREAQGDDDRTLVASVFHNRLKSTQYPYLQSCATVQYILKERKTVLSVADTKIDSPYNTYQNPGLPKGPIASPGKEAIEAALYPAKTDYLFFVLDSSGKHRFAKTFAEHQENMRK